jgi:hypothetical protein
VLDFFIGGVANQQYLQPEDDFTPAQWIVAVDGYRSEPAISPAGR